jgi:hypothetical protein
MTRGLVFKAHRLFIRLESNKEEEERRREDQEVLAVSWSPRPLMA